MYDLIQDQKRSLTKGGLVRFIAVFFLTVLLSCPAWAAFKGPNTDAAPVTVALEAQQAAKGATCVLEGYITNQVQKDRYTFEDKSGSLTVAIPPHVFGAVEITPGNLVKITGEVRGRKDPNRPPGCALSGSA